MDERVLALDIGDKRIGIAVCDENRKIARPLITIERVGYKPDSSKIQNMCNTYKTTHIIAGLPINMDGTHGEQALKILAFGKILAEAGLRVVYHDERLSTVEAMSILHENKASRASSKGRIDAVSAAVILQRWLDMQANIIKG